MRLARVLLNPRAREVRLAMRDAQRLHALVLRAAPDGVGPSARRALGVLFRLDADGPSGLPVLVVQSSEALDWGALGDALLDAGDKANPEERDLDADLSTLAAGALCVFRLRANVTRKIDTRSGPDGAVKHGRRVPLRDAQARVAWLQRKAEASGFSLVQGVSDAPEVRVSEGALLRGQRDGREVTFEGVQFDGILRVDDPAKLREAVRAGVGPAKAYGFGMLSLRRL